MQSDIVERVARAICRKYWAGAYLEATLDQVVDQDWPQWDQAAIAALEATEITALRDRVARLEGALRQIVDRPKGKPASGLAVVSELCLIANLALSDSPPATDGV